LNLLRRLETGEHYCRVISCNLKPNSVDVRGGPLTLTLNLELLGPDRMNLAKHTSPATLGALAIALGIFVSSAPRGSSPKVATPEVRHEAVEKAVHISRLVRVDALPLDLPNSFSPPQFELTDAEEAAASGRGGQAERGGARGGRAALGPGPAYGNCRQDLPFGHGLPRRPSHAHVW